MLLNLYSFVCLAVKLVETKISDTKNSIYKLT